MIASLDRPKVSHILSSRMHRRCSLDQVLLPIPDYKYLSNCTLNYVLEVGIFADLADTIA